MGLYYNKDLCVSARGYELREASIISMALLVARKISTGSLNTGVLGSE